MKNTIKTIEEIEETGTLICSYGDQVRCKINGFGIVVKNTLPCYPGPEREELKAQEAKIKGTLVESAWIKVRFSFGGTTYWYTSKGIRINASSRLPEGPATLSGINKIK